MALLTDPLKEIYLSHPEKTFWVAYSGGLDSHVLLHALAAYRESIPINIHALHIHHGLSPNADNWYLHCEKICAELSIPFFSKKVSIDKHDARGMEAAARAARYQVFEEFLTENSLLLTAHHQNDQAETVLLQLLRGAGPKGLAGMPLMKNFGKSLHFRPFLNITREELNQYALQHQLQWIEDESNEKINYTRNFIRHKLMPLLTERWPSVATTLSRVAENCADTQTVLKEILPSSRSLTVSYLCKLSLAQQRLVLRDWIDAEGYVLPSAKKLDQIIHQLMQAKKDRMPLIRWGNQELRRYRDHLFITPISQEMVFSEMTWSLSTPLMLPGVGELKSTVTLGEGLHPAIKEVQVTFRKGGERCRLPGRKFHHELKNLFQQWGIPPWQREKIPLIYVGNELAAVVGFCVCGGFNAAIDELGNSLSLV